jgi:DNA-binding GntR family transcriptional regulator
MVKVDKVKSNGLANPAKIPTEEVTTAVERHKSARDLIRSALLKRISEGVYLPGERLKEMVLAHEFEVSQAPVREAFRELETLGLLVSQHYKGTRVRGISSQEIRDAYQLRGYLEEIAVQLIPPPKRNDAIACAETSQAAMRAAALRGDPDGFARANMEFHRDIVSLASNQMLLKVWDSLEIGMLSRLNLQKNERKLRSLAEIHQPIVDSLKRRDLKHTGALLREHAFSFLQDLP